MRSVPRFQIFRNHNGFIVRIQSEVLNGPRLHVVHIFSIGRLGAVGKHQLIFQHLLSAEYTEGQCVAGGFPPQFIGDGHADIVSSGLCRRAGQCDGTVVNGIDAGHSGIISLRRIVMIYDIDGRPFGFYADVTFAQELPVAVYRIRTCFYQCHLNAGIAVLVLGNVGGCAADGIVPLLVHQSGFKAAHQPNVQLHVIARIGPLRNGKLAVIDGNLKGQGFVPFRRDGNHVAALQRRGLAVALLRKFQYPVSNAIFSTRGRRKAIGFPIRSVDGNLRDGIRILRIPER